MDGGEIKNLRIALQLSQQQLAQLVGVSFATVNRWENNRNQPHRNQEQKLLELSGGGARIQSPRSPRKPTFGAVAGKAPPIEDYLLVDEPDWVLQEMFGAED